MFGLEKILHPAKKKPPLDREKVADLLQTDPAALALFEEKYQEFAKTADPSGFFQTNSRQAAEMYRSEEERTKDLEELEERIVNELLATTSIYTYKGGKVTVEAMNGLPEKSSRVTVAEVNTFPAALQPQLTGFYLKRDIEEPAYYSLVYYWDRYLHDKDPEVRKWCYNHFRQGLDILDLDDVTYQIIDRNLNSIGHWFPLLVAACEGSPLKLPATTIAKVPLPLLQLTRQDYGLLTETTKRIVDKWAFRAFHLEEDSSYFVKTGTYSSKFDFRNCMVTSPKEVRELGEYLLFVHFQANQMASPLATPCIYGVSTTTEWVVREYIQDKENNPTIYKGLPLHTEYRVFVDCDTDQVIGISPYWEPNTMKTRFAEGAEKDPHYLHDYMIYRAHEPVLMSRYEKNKDAVVAMVQEILPRLDLPGQWSVDVMQNGDDFWVIDMALAEQSAFYDCVPKELRNPTKEDWIPRLEEHKNGKADEH